MDSRLRGNDEVVGGIVVNTNQAEKWLDFSGSRLTMAPNLATFCAMEITTFTEVSKDFSAAMDRVVDDHIPIAITQRDGKPVVMLSLEDWNFVQSKIGGELTQIGD